MENKSPVHIALDECYKANGIDPIAIQKNRVEIIRLMNEDDRIPMCIITFSDEDIFGRAEELNIPMTTEIATDILYRCYKHHDCEQGLSWTTIDYWIEEINKEHVEHN